MVKRSEVVVVYEMDVKRKGLDMNGGEWREQNQVCKVGR